MEDGSGDKVGYGFRGIYDGSVGIFLFRSIVYGIMWALACALWTALYFSEWAPAWLQAWYKRSLEVWMKRFARYLEMICMSTLIVSRRRPEIRGTLRHTFGRGTEKMGFLAIRRGCRIGH